MTTQRSNRNERDEQVARTCRQHLFAEEDLLTAIRQSLVDVRRALLCSDWSALPALLAFQDRLIEDERILAGVRERFRYELAGRLGLASESVTLLMIVRTLPEALATPLLDQRERILGIAREAEALRKANSVLVSYSLDFSRNLLRGQSGPEAPERYGPAGRRQAIASPCLIQGRG